MLPARTRSLNYSDRVNTTKLIWTKVEYRRHCSALLKPPTMSWTRARTWLTRQKFSKMSLHCLALILTTSTMWSTATEPTALLSISIRVAAIAVQAAYDDNEISTLSPLNGNICFWIGLLNFECFSASKKRVLGQCSKCNKPVTVSDLEIGFIF